MNRGFNTAISGLNSARMGLAVTGHNMANVTTPGFTRQQSIQTTFTYQSVGNNLQVGLGNDIAMIRQIRDRFLDMQFRGEIGRMSFHGVVYTTGNRLEEILGELQSQYSTLSIKHDLWDAINELVSHPSGIHTRRSFIASMQSYITKMNNVQERMLREQDTLDTEIRSTVTRINQITTRINQLNGDIALHEASGQRANDFRDERNLLLDELSRLIPIDYRENARGEISILTGGNELLAHGFVQHIGLRFTAPGSHLVEPVFTTPGRQILAHDDEVTPLFRYGPVGKEFGNDNSELFGLMVARGMYRTNYRSLQDSFELRSDLQTSFVAFVVATRPGDPPLPNFPAPGPILGGPVPPTDDSDFPLYLEQLRNYFDGVRTQINGELTTARNDLALLDPDDPADEAAIAELQARIAGLEAELATLNDLDFNVTGTGVSLEFFTRDFNNFTDPNVFPHAYFNGMHGVVPTTQRQMDVLFNHTVRLINDSLNGIDLNGNWGVPIFTQIIPGLGYTMGNVRINPLLLEPNGHNLIGLAEDADRDANGNPRDGVPWGDRDDGRRAQALLDAWTRPTQIFRHPDRAHDMHITDAYAFVVNNLAGVTNRAFNTHTAQVDLINELDNRRISMSGVSMDEEMRNMMLFQHAFNAASRIVNVIDSMIDRVINGFR